MSSGAWGTSPWGTTPWGGGGTTVDDGPEWIPYDPLAAQALPAWAVHVRDADLQLVGQITAWVELRVIERHNDVGAWVLTCSAADPLVADLLAPRAGVAFVRDTEVITTGPVRAVEIVNDGRGTWVTFAGPDDLTHLADRVAKAEPQTAAPGYTAQRYDRRDGQASTILLEYVDANLGDSATADRRLEGLALVDDPAVGSDLTERGRYGVLLDLARRIARRSTPHLAFTIRHGTVTGDRWSLAEELTFDVRAARDRSAEVIWTADLAGLDGWRYRFAAPDYTYVIGGGARDGLVSGKGKVGTDRVIAEAGNGAASRLWGRIERFVDQREITNLVDEGDGPARAVVIGTGGTRTVAILNAEKTPFEVGCVGWILKIDGGLYTITGRTNAYTVTIDDSYGDDLPDAGGYPWKLFDPDLAPLRTHLTEELDAITSEFVFEAAVADGPGPYGWLTEWRTGDLITVEIAGQRHTERIREVEIVVDGRGEHVAPKVGSEAAVFGGAQSRTHALLRRLAQRAAALEQNY